MRVFPVVLAVPAGMLPGVAGAEVAPGTTIDQSNATVSGQNGPGADPPNDRGIPLDPSFFDYQTLNRFGK